MNQVGFHFVDSVYTEAEINKHFGLLNDCKPACITILGGSQYKEALDFAKRAKQAFPEMRVIFRHYRDGGDDGMHTRVTAREWWDKIGSLYIGTGLTILSDNESMRDDLTPYAAWQSEVMELAGQNGVGIAFGRFSTHNPPLAKIQHLDRMLITAFKFGKLHTYSPNLYWSLENTDGFKYPRAVMDYAHKIGVTIDVTIGEFALLRDIRDAHHGWRSCNVSGKAYAYDMVIKSKVHLPGIPVCAYSIGQWPIGSDTFSLDKEALDTIKFNPTPLVKPTNPPYTPPIPEPAVGGTTTTAPPPTPDTRPLPLDYIQARMAEVTQRIADEKQMIAVREIALAADKARLAALEAEHAILTKAVA